MFEKKFSLFKDRGAVNISDMHFKMFRTEMK